MWFLFFLCIRSNSRSVSLRSEKNFVFSLLFLDKQTIEILQAMKCYFPLYFLFFFKEIPYFYFRNNKRRQEADFSLWPRHIKGSVLRFLFFRVRGSLVFSTRVNFSSPFRRRFGHHFGHLRRKARRWRWRHSLWAASAIRNACAQNGTASGYDIGIYIYMFRGRLFSPLFLAFLSPHFIVATSVFFFTFLSPHCVCTFKNESSSEMMIKCCKTHPSFLDFKVRKSFVTVCDLSLLVLGWSSVLFLIFFFGLSFYFVLSTL